MVLLLSLLHLFVHSGPSRIQVSKYDHSLSFQGPNSLVPSSSDRRAPSSAPKVPSLSLGFPNLFYFKRDPSSMGHHPQPRPVCSPPLGPYPEVDLHLSAVFPSPILDEQGLSQGCLSGGQEECPPYSPLLLLPVQLELHCEACSQEHMFRRICLSPLTYSERREVPKSPVPPSPIPRPKRFRQSPSPMESGTCFPEALRQKLRLMLEEDQEESWCIQGTGILFSTYLPDPDGHPPFVPFPRPGFSAHSQAQTEVFQTHSLSSPGPQLTKPQGSPPSCSCAPLG